MNADATKLLPQTVKTYLCAFASLLSNYLLSLLPLLFHLFDCGKSTCCFSKGAATTDESEAKFDTDAVCL